MYFRALAILCVFTDVTEQAIVFPSHTRETFHGQ